MSPDLTEVATGVFFVAASHTNFVLLVDGDEIALVDSGYPKDRALVEAAVAAAGRQPSDLSSLILTHGHVDHLGSAEWLRREHDVPVRCHDDDAALARGEIQQRISLLELRKAWRPRIFRFALNAIAKGGLSPEHVVEVETFGDGALLDAPGRPAAIHTPGHTDGHVGFHLADAGVLISGDALITVDVWDPADTGPQLIRAPFNHDHQQAVRSVDRYAAVEADVIVPGHGEPVFRSPASAVESALRREGAR